MGRKAPPSNSLLIALGSAYDYIKSFDYYGTPVTFNYKGNETYQTMPGAILSLFFRVVLVVFLYFKGSQLIFDTNWSLATQQVV